MANKSDKNQPPPGFKEVYQPTQEAAAYCVGITARSVQRYVADGTYKRTQRGWPVHALATRAKGDEIDSSSVRAAKHVADLRYKVAMAELAERRNKVEEGLYMSVAEAQEWRLELLRWVVAVFDRSGAELSAQILGKPPNEVRRIVTDYFNRIRERATRDDH